MLFLNDMLDYYLLIDNNFKSFFNEDLSIEIDKYNKMLDKCNKKLKKIKEAYLDELIDKDEFITEEQSIKSQINCQNLMYSLVQLPLLEKRGSGYLRLISIRLFQIL